MANGLYEKSAQKFGQGSLSWGGTLKAALLTSAYSVNLVTHEFYSSAVAAVVGTPQTITSPLVLSDGVCDGDDVIWTALTGSAVAQMVIYKDLGGSNTTWPLIVYIDTMSGLPFTPNGTDVNLTWDNGADRIFRL